MTPPANLIDLVELARRAANAIRYGAIHDVDHAKALARVAYAKGEEGNPVLTGWLPFWTRMAGEDVDWRPPSPGEQAIILSPSGELASGVILAGVSTRDFKAPDASPHKHVVVYRDGARIEYDAEEHALSAVLPDGAIAMIAPEHLILERGESSIVLDDDGIAVTAPAIRLDGPVTINGSLAASGDAAFEGPNVRHAGRDIGKSHAHGGVQPGSAVTGPPA